MERLIQLYFICIIKQRYEYKYKYDSYIRYCVLNQILLCSRKKNYIILIVEFKLTYCHFRVPIYLLLIQITV